MVAKTSANGLFWEMQESWGSFMNREPKSCKVCEKISTRRCPPLYILYELQQGWLHKRSDVVERNTWTVATLFRMVSDCTTIYKKTISKWIDFVLHDLICFKIHQRGSCYPRMFSFSEIFCWRVYFIHYTPVEVTFRNQNTFFLAKLNFG